MPGRRSRWSGSMTSRAGRLWSAFPGRAAGRSRSPPNRRDPPASTLTGPCSFERREAALVEILETESELPEAFIAALKARAERNGRLLLASLAGVKAGIAEIERMRAAGDRLQTYAPTGARVDVTPPPVTRDQRA